VNLVGSKLPFKYYFRLQRLALPSLFLTENELDEESLSFSDNPELMEGFCRNRLNTLFPVGIALQNDFIRVLLVSPKVQRLQLAGLSVR